MNKDQSNLTFRYLYLHLHTRVPRCHTIILVHKSPSIKNNACPHLSMTTSTCSSFQPYLNVRQPITSTIRSPRLTRNCQNTKCGTERLMAQFQLRQLTAHLETGTPSTGPTAQSIICTPTLMDTNSRKFENIPLKTTKPSTQDTFWIYTKMSPRLTSICCVSRPPKTSDKSRTAWNPWTKWWNSRTPRAGSGPWSTSKNRPKWTSGSGGKKADPP